MIKCYIGLPRCGKTTFACSLIKKALDEGRPVVANFNQSLCPVIDATQLGRFTPVRGSLVVLDEAGIDFNGRHFKDFSDYLIKWFKLHGHGGYTVVILSQFWDFDQTIKRIVEELWYMKRLPFFTIHRKIIKRFDLDSNSMGEPCFSYRWASFLRHILPFPFHQKGYGFTFRPLYYKYFNTSEFPPLPLFHSVRGFDYDYRLSLRTRLRRKFKQHLRSLLSRGKREK